MRGALTIILFITALGIFLGAVNPHTVFQAILAILGLFIFITWPFPKKLAIAIYKDIKELLNNPL